MKTLRCLLTALLFTLGLTGCLQVEKVVKLQPDGSGTIEETVMMSKQALAELQQMASGFVMLDGKKAEEKPAKRFEMLDEKKLKAAAAGMGEGVTFVSAKKAESGKGSGFTAVYAFTDISKVQLDQNPGDSLPTSGALKSVPKPELKREPITFKFTKGSPAELVLKMPQPELKKEPKPEQSAGLEEMAMGLMKEMIKDMKLKMSVEVAGTITETNAEYHDGARVTLMEVDLNKLLADPKRFKKLMKENPKTLQESKALLKGIDGIKVETAPEVRIKFQ